MTPGPQPVPDQVQLHRYPMAPLISLYLAVVLPLPLLAPAELQA